MTHARLVPFFLVLALSAPVVYETADLKPHTLEAFLLYARLTEAEFLEQVHSGDFLRIENERRIDPTEAQIDLADAQQRIDAGDVYITRLKTRDDAGEEIDVKNGIVHHWYGAVFVDDVELDQVLEMVKNYDDHHQVFGPDVEASGVLNENEAGDVFDIHYRFNKTKVITVVLETEHHVEYTRVSGSRAYSMSRTTKVQEVDDPDGANELKLPDTGRGLVWRINSYWRFEQQDGGTFIECESITLTRDIPLLLKPFVSPFVTNVPKDTLTATLENARDELLSPDGQEPDLP